MKNWFGLSPLIYGPRSSGCARSSWSALRKKNFAEQTKTKTKLISNYKYKKNCSLIKGEKKNIILLSYYFLGSRYDTMIVFYVIFNCIILKYWTTWKWKTNFSALAVFSQHVQEGLSTPSRTLLGHDHWLTCALSSCGWTVGDKHYCWYPLSQRLFSFHFRFGGFGEDVVWEAAR